MKVLGRIPSGERLKKIQQSPNYRDGAFRNLQHTPVMAEDSSIWKVFRSQLQKHPGRRPEKTLPFMKPDLRNLDYPSPVVVWFGHSSYLLRINSINILVDPVLSNHASPFSFMVKAYAGADQFAVEDMPDIDILLITHDHYDHLDFESVGMLRSRVKKVVTSLGVGEHLEYWGFAPGIITELDWWQGTELLPDLSLTATPARHFSGRGMLRGKTLWSSFVLQTERYHIFIGGDSGYGEHFREIGERFGPFQLALLECGQYDANWKYIHTMPEETVKAAIDLRAKRLMPLHWSKFTLSLHRWDEPIRRVTAAAKSAGLPITTPKIGEPVLLEQYYPEEHWWELV